MVRDYLYSLCGGALMLATWTGFGAYIAPEPAEVKLARIRAGVDWSHPATGSASDPLHDGVDRHCRA
jgi:hypothetical protein